MGLSKPLQGEVETLTIQRREVVGISRRFGFAICYVVGGIRAYSPTLQTRKKKTSKLLAQKNPLALRSQQKDILLSLYSHSITPALIAVMFEHTTSPLTSG